MQEQKISLFLKNIGFQPQDGESGIFYKKYKAVGNYCVKVNLEEKKFDFGDKIKSESGTTLNFSQEENWVVLECVNRLLEKGYKPEDIILEKTFKVGHGVSGGRLDIFVKKEGEAFLMIECKTYGKEYNKELANIYKNGGQLLTYFQNDTKADYLMLYASVLMDNDIKTKQSIIKIEDHYRDAGNVVDVFERWNKITFENGIFDDWVAPYFFENKRIIKKELIPLDEESSIGLFHNFLSILRKHSVSDKPNAFNVIFDLFLAKLWDEKKEDDEEMEFQWRENADDPVEFQYRLLKLYRAGMDDFLKKEVFALSDSDFSANTNEELKKIKKKVLMLEKVFNIKSVIDEESFADNHKVLKEIVELLQRYRIRYPRKQQYLSDFFERLLTTGLKQEAGQFFTPPPITRFIVKSLPIKEVVTKSINQPSPELPAVIDYAAGSGHFLTEIMEEYQTVIDTLDIDHFRTDAKIFVKKWQVARYDWAAEYVYGIDKDYRLVKTAKVGCYFYGDGLAQVIHGDGLDNFDNSKSYRGLLRKNGQKPQFQFVLSNPPYSVSKFKTTLRAIDAEKDFTLFDYLTDNSKEIECLFIERTKQLLKDDGVAGIILPSSILSNAGIYTKAREIILQYFEIIAITELGSNTFMATGTNTVVLFLRRRNNYVSINLRKDVEKFFADHKDVTMNGIEKPVSKYVNHVWEGLMFDDYASLLKKMPNKNTEQHEIYKEYRKKLKAKNETDFWEQVLEREAEKLFYFILAYPQKVVLIKSGEKDAEKHFLGYEFSNRRGCEGIHPIQRGKSISDCTKLFDENSFDNPEKASTYVYRAFRGDYETPIHETLQKNISRHDLVDMLTFDRVDFEKNISLAVRKKVKIESKWGIKRLGEICDLYQPKTITSQEILDKGKYKVFGANGVIGYYNKYNHEESEIAVTCRGATCGTVNFTEPKSWITGNAMVVKPKTKIVNKKFLFFLLLFSDLSGTITGTAQPQITRTTLEPYQIPLPSLDIQKKIVAEIEALGEKEDKAKGEIERLKNEVDKIIVSCEKFPANKIEVIAQKIFAGGDLPKNNRYSLVKTAEYTVPIYSNSSQNDGLYGYTDIEIVKEECVTISARGTIGFTKVRNTPFYPIIRLLVLIPKREIATSKYLEYAIKRLNLSQFGVSTPQLSVPQLSGFEVPLPPLPKQKKIVAEIEKIESKISVLEKELAEIPQQKEKILRKYL